MKWNTPVSDFNRKDGEIRISSYFPIIPLDVLGRTYWLEKVVVKEEWHVPRCEGYFHQWVPIEVMNK